MIELIYPGEPARLVHGAKPDRSVEMLPVVDENGVVTAQASRNFCHNIQHRLLHPVVHLHIINREGCVYIQKRASTKKLYPDMWDTAVGGHISYGEYVHEALYREAGEEIGLFDFNPLPLESYVFECDAEKELVCAFAAVGNFELRPDRDEVSEGRYWPIPEIEASLGRGVFTYNFEQEFIRFKNKLLSYL